jgi:23S rRNA (cytidine1920-2'-O)/16S rRNA (cytidine1409-2'-O)-methyltransferase
VLHRLDAELVRRKLARSREAAQELIVSGKVQVDGFISDKPARQVQDSASIVLIEEQSPWVSRGAYKLLGALEAFSPFGLNLAGKNVLDAGASTGGFTQVSLHSGAARVLAVDVGYGQLAWELRQNPQVEILERFNIRFLEPKNVPFPIEVIVADLSFISLKTVLPAIVRCIEDDADLVLMVKPQFEVGKDAVGEGVVTDPTLRADAVLGVVQAAQHLGCGLRRVQASPLPGPSGNVEFFVWLTRGAASMNAEECTSVVNTAVQEGPQ